MPPFDRKIWFVIVCVFKSFVSGRDKKNMSQMTGVKQTHYRGQLQGDGPK